eukprot:4152724-Prymnesium_polylepis.1
MATKVYTLREAETLANIATALDTTGAPAAAAARRRWTPPNLSQSRVDLCRLAPLNVALPLFASRQSTTPSPSSTSCCRPSAARPPTARAARGPAGARPRRCRSSTPRGAPRAARRVRSRT